MDMRTHKKQNGATLIVALIILVVLMILGVGALMSSNTQSKLSGNLQFEAEAKIRAENSAAAAEAWLSVVDGAGRPTNANNPEFTAACNAAKVNKFIYPLGCLAAQVAPDNNPLTMTWDGTNSAQVFDVNGNAVGRYLIELAAPMDRDPDTGGSVPNPRPTICNRFNVFRITARGTNARGAVKVIQSVFQVKNCPY